jgi:hypothetical protein
MATSSDHPDKDAATTNPTRPSIDPADTMGDNEHRPDVPTEPPDQPEGTREQRSEPRVETREVRSLRVSTEGAETTGDDGDDERRLAVPDEPPDELYSEPCDREGVQVEPGGETATKLDGSVTHGSVDARRRHRRGGHIGMQSAVESVEM